MSMYLQCEFLNENPRPRYILNFYRKKYIYECHFIFLRPPVREYIDTNESILSLFYCHGRSSRFLNMG